MRLVTPIIVVLMATAGWSAIAQPAPGPAASPGPAVPAPGAGRTGPSFDVGRMVDALAQRLHLTPAEKATTEHAMRAKTDAAAGLSRELRALSDVARNEKSTDKELSAALKRYDEALASYRQRIKAIDAQFSKALSLRARASLTAVGVLDNGFGFGGRFGGRMRRGAAGEGPGKTGGYGRAPQSSAAPTGMPRVVR